MVAMGMGSTKRGVVWCAGLLVAGLLLVAVDADFCSEDCRGKPNSNFMACCNRHRHVRRAPLHLRRVGEESTRHEEEARGGATGVLKAPARPTPCEMSCRDQPDWVQYQRCLDYCGFAAYVRRAPLHLRRAGGESRAHEEKASGGAVGVLKAPAPAPCEVVCRDRVGWVEYERCLDRCRWGAYVRRALLHLKLADGESAAHEELLTAMAARLWDACQDLCRNHEHYDWCVRHCRFGPHLKLAGGESEEASGGAVDDWTATAAVTAADPRVCEDFCRNWPAPDHDWCIEFCLIGAYVQRAPLHLKLAGGESTTHEEEEEKEARGGAVDVSQATATTVAQVQQEVAAGAQPMDTDPCEDYCMEQTRYFPRPGQFFDCVEECHAGHGRLARYGRNGILRHVKQDPEKKDAQVQLASGGRNGIPPAAAAAAAAQHEAAAAGAQPVNTETCEAYCKRHARDFPAKYTACMRQCQSGGHPGDSARVKQERHKKHGEVSKKIAIE